MQIKHSTLHVLLTICLFGLCCPSTFGKSDGGMPYRKAGGYIDRTGQTVIKPQFDLVTGFTDGLAAVAPDDGHPATWDDLRYRYIDKTGNYVSSVTFKHTYDYSEGLMPAKINGLFGYVNVRGEVKIQPQFGGAYPFNQGMAQVSKDNIQRIIDKSGKTIWQAGLQKESISKDGFFIVNLNGVTFFGIDENSKDGQTTPKAVLRGRFADQSLASAKTNEHSGGNSLFRKYGYIDKTGTFAISPKFESAGEFSEDLARVILDGKQGYINRKGEMVISFDAKVDNAGEFHDGMAPVVWKAETDDLPPELKSYASSKVGYIDKEGRVVIEPRYSHLGFSFSEGLVCAALGDGDDCRWGFIDKQGKTAIPFIFRGTQDFSEGLAPVTFDVDNSLPLVPAPSLTLRGYDKSLREKIYQCCAGLLFDRSLRIELSIDHDNKISAKIAKGTGDAARDKNIEAKLASLTPPNRLSVFRDQDMLFRYCVSSKGVTVAGAPGDPEFDVLQRISSLNAELAPLAEHNNRDRRMGISKELFELNCLLDESYPEKFSNEASELVRMFIERGRLTEADALTKKLYSKWPDKFRDDLFDLLEKEGKLTRAAELLEDDVKHSQPVDQNSLMTWTQKIDKLGDFYYRQKRYPLAEREYRLASTYETGSVAAKTPYENFSRYGGVFTAATLKLACFYAAIGKTRLAETYFDRVLLVESNVGQKIMAGDSSYIPLLALLHDKDQKTYLRVAAKLDLNRAKANGWGYIDHQGKIVIAPKFEQAEPFSEGLARVQLGEGIGFVDRQGEWVLWPFYGFASSFSEGLAAVSQPCELFPGNRTSSGVGFIDKTGKFVIKPKFGSAFEFSEGLVGVALDAGYNDYGYIDKKGNEIFGPHFSEPNKFKNGLAKPLIAVWPYSEPPHNGRYDGYLIVIRPDGIIPKPPNLNNPSHVAHDEELLNPFFIKDNDGTKWGFETMDGGVVVPPIYEEVKLFSEKLAPVKQQNKWGYIDRAGKMIIRPQYQNADDFENGMARVSTVDSRQTYIDLNGKDLYPSIRTVEKFSDDLAPASMDGGGTYGLINRKGEFVCAPQFTQIREFSEGLAAVRVRNDLKWGFIDHEGRMVIEPKYDAARNFADGLAPVLDRF